MSLGSQYDERILLKQISEGDESAFRTLFHYWHQIFAGYVIRITGRRELAEEILQDVFLKIWLNRRTLSGINNFKHYLFVVGRNHAYSALKKLMMEEKKHKNWQSENVVFAATGSQENNDYGSLIDEAIDHLPPKRKEIYLLSRHERLTYHEIASRLSISRESVKTHLKLATDDISSYLRSTVLKVLVLLAILLEKL